MKMMNWIRRAAALTCCLAMSMVAVGCSGGGDSVNTSSGTTTGTTEGLTDNTMTDGKPNPPVRIPAAPEKPAVDPTTLCAYGRPAPKWLRETEMYQHGSYLIPENYDYDVQEWAPYFSFITGSAWDTATNSTYRELGVRSDSYFDPYHVFTNEDIAVMTARGECVQSDYVEPGRNDLYVVCHNCPEVTLPWAYAYIDRAMSFGQTGMFFDDIRAPYDSIAKAYNTCYSTKHAHTLNGTNTENYFGSTLPSIYNYVKSKNPDYYVILNGGNPLADPSDVSTAQKVWPFADGLMWEHAIYDSLTNKWCSWGMLKSAAALLAPGIANGKTEMLLSYSYNKMNKDLALEASVYTIAYCRLYDFAWSDYNTLLTSPLSKDLVKELYSTKTGPAGDYGVFYGRVLEEGTGAAIPGVTVEAGSVKYVTDDNGAFSIKTPINTTTVKLTRAGYETVQHRLTGYRDELTMKKTEGNVYYVAPFGSNDNDGKSASAPWRSINYGDVKKLLKPGDTVVLLEGTYTVPNQTFYTASGTADAPITYVADGDVVIRTAAGEGSPFVLSGSYMVWDGIRFEGSEKGVKSLMTILGEGNHIRNCKFSDTAFYNAADKLSAEAAVTIRGEGTKFHHNVIGSDIYAPVALLVEAKKADILHNTFDGSLAAGGKAAGAMKLTAPGATIQVKNNIFTNFMTAYIAGSAGAVFGGNLFSNTELGDAACAGEKDLMGKDPSFMWQPTGDYDLKRVSAAVNAGVNAGFAYRGSAPDIGAYETAYNSHYDAMLNGRVMVRTFANTVVLLNTTKAEQTVEVSLGVAGAKLREVGYGGTYTADGSGSLQVKIPPDRAMILVGVDE